MNNHALLLVDSNELRAAAFAALLSPWTQQADVVLHVVHDPADIPNLPDHTPSGCLYSLGAQSLRDPGVLRNIAKLRKHAGDGPLIVFSDNPDGYEIAAAIDNGLRGFLPTTMSSHVALAAIQFILNGGTYHPHSPAASRPAAPLATINNIIDHHPPRVGAVQLAAGMDNDACATCELSARPRPDHLTKKRHVQVLEYLAKGETNKEIARRLDLTEATIKVYVRELMKHFGAKNRVQVVLKASDVVNSDVPDLPPAVSRLPLQSNMSKAADARVPRPPLCPQVRMR